MVRADSHRRRRAFTRSFGVISDRRGPGELFGAAPPEEIVGIHMFATIRRYESVDQSRTAELVKKLDETLLPRLSKLPGFGGYHLIKADDGIMSSVGFFDTSAQADESTKLVSS